MSYNRKRYREWEDPELHYYEDERRRKDEFIRYHSPIHSEKGSPRRHRTPTRRHGFPQYRDNRHVVLDKKEVPYYRPERSISQPFKHYRTRYSYEREEYRRHDYEYRSHSPVYNVKRKVANYDQISSNEDYQLREMSPRGPSRRSRLHYTDKSVVKEESISQKRISLKTKCKREKCDHQEQKRELKATGSRSPSPNTKRILKNNVKIQELQKKLNEIKKEVLSIETGEDVDQHTNSRKQRTDTAPQEEQKKHKTRWRRKCNYKFYDPELHWCRSCNVFPQTAKDYLTHLHTPGHKEAAAECTESPWQVLAGDEGFQNLPDVPDKMIPIRGLQFFFPAAAWYCKLCNRFVGDLNVASEHIRSFQHAKNFTKFYIQNPHWEADWMSDRQKAFEQARDKHCSARALTPPIAQKTNAEI